MNTKPKYLVSNTLTEPRWADTTVLSGDVAAAVGELKAKPGGELQVHGSGALIRWLLDNDLVDEMTLLIVPVVLGQGTRLFPDAGPDIALDLVDSRADSKGVTIQVYRPTGRPRYQPPPPTTTTNDPAAASGDIPEPWRRRLGRRLQSGSAAARSQIRGSRAARRSRVPRRESPSRGKPTTALYSEIPTCDCLSWVRHVAVHQLRLAFHLNAAEGRYRLENDQKTTRRPCEMLSLDVALGEYDFERVLVEAEPDRCGQCRCCPSGRW